jgi:hypothetical protein
MYNQRRSVRLTAYLAIKFLMGNYCIRWRGIFKGLSRSGGWAEFSKKPPRLSLMKAYRMSLIWPDPSRWTVPLTLELTLKSITAKYYFCKNSSFLLTVRNEMENNRQLTQEKVYCNRKMETTSNLNFCTMEMTFFSIDVVRVNWIKP